MEFRTIVDVPKMGFEIEPCEEMLFVGSCFADAIGRRFQEEGFPVVVNPYGTMYNPVSVLHTITHGVRNDVQCSREHCTSFLTPCVKTVFLTLGTNHVYRLKETGEIVDNCEKRPQRLFQEEELTVEQCADSLREAVALLRQVNPDVRIVLTVSPIRYRKYGYHESQLSKATLLLAVNTILKEDSRLAYFPAYELVLDELRDYRFYASDMLHPSEQAVDYIWERLVEACFSKRAKTFLEEWRPVRQALAHKPFNPDSADYRQFLAQTEARLAELRAKYPGLTVTGQDK